MPKRPNDDEVEEIEEGLDDFEEELERFLRRINRKLNQIIQSLKPKATKVGFQVTTADGTVLKGVTQVNLLNTQNVTLSTVITDATGAPALVNGAPVWTSSNPAVVSVVAAADGLSALASGLTVGTATVSVIAESSFVAGVSVPITGTLDFNVTASTGGVATTIAIVAGVPVTR